MAVLLETTMGDIVVDLYPSERPRCCLNFLKLCKMKYYNFNLFHSVQRSFMAQTGDPSGTGSGGESIYCHIEGDDARFFDMESHPRIKHKKKGSISMVNNGSNQHGSQFFVTLREDIDYLDGIHTVFGEVTEGFDVLDKISETFCDSKHRPLQDIRINHTVILDDPFDDPEGLEFPDKSPEIDPYKLKSDRIAADEDVGGEEKTLEEVEEETQTHEAKANAQILEMIGDLPDADVKPPENVLFVCKLNPVTTSEDLEIIFSRFGKLGSCEVIKDQATGDSLCYSFVEFEREEDCEEAYFKMDNVLIDDRRIHVDFSQSVAKLQFKGKGPVMPQRSSNSQTGQRSRGARNPRFPGNRRGGMMQRDQPKRMKDRRKGDGSDDSSTSSMSPPRGRGGPDGRGRSKSEERDRSKERRKKQSMERVSSHGRGGTDGRGRDRPDGKGRDKSEERHRSRERSKERSRERRKKHSMIRDSSEERTVKRRDDERRDGSKRNDRNKRDRGGRDYKEQQHNKRGNERQARSSSRERSHDQSSSKRRDGSPDKRSSRDDSRRRKRTGRSRQSESSGDESSSSEERRKSQKRRGRDLSDDEDESLRTKRKKKSKIRKDETSPDRRQTTKKRNRRSRSLSS